MIHNWILIAVLAISTYLSRIMGLEIMAGRELNPTLRLYLQYVPVGIISALIVTQILVPSDGQPSISIPVLTACLTTVIMMQCIKTLLPSIVIGILSGLVTRYL